MRIVALTLILGTLVASDAIAEEAVFTNDAILQFTYVVKDAPVWTADGKFDPAVLIKLIEASTDFGEATSKYPLRIHSFPKTGALSIGTTIAVHEQIWRLLKQFPALAAARGSVKPDYAKLLDEQTSRQQRNIELNQLSDRIERNRRQTLLKRHSIGAIDDPTGVRP